MVIGDLMLDRYLWGRVERISPEAPVPIVDITHDENRLGGAANVALNVHAMGAIPVMCGVVGRDNEGKALIELAKKKNFDTSLILESQHRRTTVKIRVIGNQQQVLRVDKEDRFRLNNEEKQVLFPRLMEGIDSVDAIIFEDYDKSMIDPELIQVVVERAGEKGIPIMVDPKFKQFWDYHGVTLFKPNMKELNEGLGLKLEKKDTEAIVEGIKKMRERMPHQWSLITLSENGMLLVDPEYNWQHFPAHYRDITDVSGAGDTVISVMSLGMAAGIDMGKAAYYANLAGGLVCEEVGVVPIKPEKLAAEARRLQPQ